MNKAVSRMNLMIERRGNRKANRIMDSIFRIEDEDERNIVIKKLRKYLGVPVEEMRKK